MDSPAGKDEETPLGDLFGRLADDGRAYLKAEAGLYRTIALRRAGKARNGLVAIFAGALLVHAALIVLLVGLALALAIRVGPLLAGLIVAAGASLGGYALIRFGAHRVKALCGDAEEKTMLAAGEKTG